MPRRIKREPVATTIADIDAGLHGIQNDIEWITLRQRVVRMTEVLHDTKTLGVNLVRDSGIDANAGMERIRLYLIEFVGEKINGEELEVVGGISEYARRIRQLRVEHGYQISTGAFPDPEAGVDLKPDEYMLLTAERDEDSARRWKVANRIRKMGGGSQDRVLEFFKENVGKVVTTEELAYVANEKKEFARRARELRTEEGYAIATRFTGRPDLKSGQYVLESLERIAEPHDRQIPNDVQKEVYRRDNNTCQMCGWTRERWTREDPRILELHHIEHHAEGGHNVPENLIVLCSRCHDEVHAGRLEIPLNRA